MGRKNAVKISVLGSESSGYHFKASSNNDAFIISSKHGLCSRKSVCELFQNNDHDCCRKCMLDIDLNNIIFKSEQHETIKPLQTYLLPGKDIAIIKVDKESYQPLRIGKNKDITYQTYGYKKSNSRVGRILLNSPEICDDICYFNIQSNSITELEEKSDGYYGVSGSLVIEKSENDIEVAYAIITTNEENNDLGADILNNICFESLNNFFGCKVFFNYPITFNIEDNFSEYFEKIHTLSLGNYSLVDILTPKHKGLPYFNLNPLAKSLLESKIGHVFGKKGNDENKNIYIAMKTLESNSDKNPASQLLASKLTELYLKAPHIYSTNIDTVDYHHVHFRLEDSGGINLIISKFGGDDNLTEYIDSLLANLQVNINNYSLDKTSLLERSFIDNVFSEEQCEYLYEQLNRKLEEVISSISILYTLPIDNVNNPDNLDLESLIIQNVKLACTLVEQKHVKFLKQGIKINLFVIPTNFENELSKIMVRKINEY